MGTPPTLLIRIVMGKSCNTVTKSSISVTEASWQLNTMLLIAPLGYCFRSFVSAARTPDSL